MLSMSGDLAPILAASGNIIRASFVDGGGWRVTADDPWWASIDMRDVLNLFHPFEISRTGSAAGASREIVIPKNWKPPFALRFYCADNYFADPEKHKPSTVRIESFFDHRYKQVLIDDEVVWDRDVIDENSIGSQTVFDVDITPFVTPGKPFVLTFRVLDKISTSKRGDRDVWFQLGPYHSGVSYVEEPPRFHTAVWFADPIVGEKASIRAASAGRRPHEAAVEVLHKRRWPMMPRGEQMGAYVDLELVIPATVSAGGTPLSCGIPMPPGALKESSHVRLQNTAGVDLPLQTKAIGWWPDNSIRWLLVNTIMPDRAKPGD